MALFKRKKPDVPEVDLKIAFGSDLAPGIVNQLGEEEAQQQAHFAALLYSGLFREVAS
jgi:hypothetical protein